MPEDGHFQQTGDVFHGDERCRQHHNGQQQVGQRNHAAPLFVALPNRFDIGAGGFLRRGICHWVRALLIGWGGGADGRTETHVARPNLDLIEHAEGRQHVNPRTPHSQ